jgi:hypothetical protein
MKALKYLAYGIFNIFYIRVILFVLLYAETYLNSSLIPDKFVWNKDGTKREHPIIWAIYEDYFFFIVEALLLLFLLYLIDKLFLRQVIKEDRSKRIAFFTVFFIAIIVFVITIVALVYNRWIFLW